MAIRSLRLVLLALAALPGFPLRATAAEPVMELEYKVKAAFLFNFTKFIEWPAGCFPAPDSPFVLGVYAGDPALPVLKQVLRGQTVATRPLLLRALAPGDDLRSCHLIFISRGEQDRRAAVLAAVQDAPVVTVGETERFAHEGGTINFVLQEGSVRLEINLEAAERVGLKISSKLAGLGKIVRTERN